MPPQIVHISQLITKPGRFVESTGLKQARRAAHATAPGQHRRQAWKDIHRQLHREHKQWKQSIADRASQHDWPAYRQHMRGKGGEEWMAALTDSHDWQGVLLAHFKAIFHKSDGPGRDADFAARCERIRRRCKETPWQPFSQDELAGVAVRWKNNKRTGPDHIAHEALHILRQPALTDGDGCLFRPPRTSAVTTTRPTERGGSCSDLCLQLHSFSPRRSCFGVY